MSEPRPPEEIPRLRRRFLQVGDRRVHYLRSGEGPPVVLVHSSPANAWLLRPEIERLSRDYTVFAFDTPGFGLSQALTLNEMTVADLANALNDTLGAIAMPRCPMFGTHSGAAIALEFGVRHPERVTGLVLDGVPAFTRAEYVDLYVERYGDFFRKVVVSDLGGHYSDAWTRFRDQSIWFPWTARDPDRLNGYDLGPPDSTQLWALMYFDAVDTFAPAYRAAVTYCERAIEAASELETPAIYTATDTDMLYPHLARLPAMKPGQEIREIGTSGAAKRELIAEGFARFGGEADAPPDQDAIGSSDGVARQFRDQSGGGQLQIRFAGRRGAPVMLLLHDAPGSAAALEPLIQALSEQCFVIAPDLPGSGESDRLPAPASLDLYAAGLDDLLTELGVPSCEVYGVGFGSSVAVALARHSPERVRRLVLEGLLLPDEATRADLAAHYAPTIAIQRNGSHWYETWLMLRDSLVWWPWYRRTAVAQRRREGDFGGERLHRWTLDVMRARDSYGDIIHAALAVDSATSLATLTCPIARLVDGAGPLAVFDDALRAAAPNAREARVHDDPRRHAETLFELLDLREVHR